MNAIQFIKEHGVEKARKVIDCAPEWAMSINFNNGMYYSRMEHKKGDTFLYDIKRLIESVDLIKSYGGIINAKHDVKYLDLDWDYDTPRITRLKQAIADYEAIHSLDIEKREFELGLAPDSDYVKGGEHV